MELDANPLALNPRTHSLELVELDDAVAVDVEHLEEVLHLV